MKDAKGAKNVPLRLKVDDKKFMIGSLAADRTQLMFDLVFEKEFELSHDWKSGSVYFIGYKADDPVSGIYWVLQYLMSDIFCLFPCKC